MKARLRPAAELFQRGHVVVERFIDERLARILYGVLRLRRWRREGKHDDQVPGADSHWGDSTLDAMLVGLQPEVEAVAGCALRPTYSYARLYLAGQSLARHRDREAAEVAVTIHLASRGKAPPPICFAPDVAVRQRPGDGVIYLGDKVEHWRDAFTGHDFGQLFLNYVRAHGPRKDLAFDGRRGAFPPDLAR